MENSTNKNVISALVTAQGQLTGVTKGSSNPAFKSKYADLSDILSMLKPVMAANGLAVIQTPTLREENGVLSVDLTTTVYHSSGECLTFPAMSMPVESKKAHAVGSAMTYVRRYSLAALFLIAQEDDDGNAASSVAKAVPSQSFGASAKPSPDGSGVDFPASAYSVSSRAPTRR